MDSDSVSLDSSNSSDDDYPFLDDDVGGGYSSVSDLGDFEIPPYDHGDFQIPSSYGAPPPLSNPDNNGSPVMGPHQSPNPILVPNQGGLDLDSSQGLVLPQYNDVGNFVTNPPNNPFGYGFDNNNNGGVGFMRNDNNTPFAPSLGMQNPSSFHGVNNNPMMMTNVVSQSGTDPFPSYGLTMPDNTNYHMDPFLRRRIVLNIPAPAPLPEIGRGRRMIPYPIELLETMQPPPAAVAPAADADAPPRNPEQMNQGSGGGGSSGGGDNRPPKKIELMFYFQEQLDKLLLSNDAPRQPIVVARIDTPEVLEAIERDDPDLYERMYKTWDTRKRKNSPSPIDLLPEKRGGGSTSGNNQFQNPGIDPAGAGGGATGGFYHL